MSAGSKGSKCDRLSLETKYDLKPQRINKSVNTAGTVNGEGLNILGVTKGRWVFEVEGDSCR